MSAMVAMKAFHYYSPAKRPFEVYRCEPARSGDVVLAKYTSPTTKVLFDGRIEPDSFVEVSVNGCSCWILNENKKHQRRRIRNFKPALINDIIKVTTDDNLEFDLQDIVVLTRDQRSTEFDWSQQADGPYFGPRERKNSDGTSWSERQLKWLNHYARIITYATEQLPILVTSYDVRPHQLHSSDRLYSGMKNHHHWLLADDAGTGKTVTACLLMLRFLCADNNARFLILCPRHLTDHWKSHITQNEMLARSDYSIKNYEAYTLSDSDSATLVVLDEAHIYFSDSKNKFAQDRTRFPNAQNVVYMTATASNSATDTLSVLLSHIDPDRFPINEATTRISKVNQLRDHISEWRKVRDAKPGTPRYESRLEKEQILLKDQLDVKTTNMDRPLNLIAPYSEYCIEHRRMSKYIGKWLPYRRAFKGFIDFKTNNHRRELVEDLFGKSTSADSGQLRSLLDAYTSSKENFEDVLDLIHTLDNSTTKVSKQKLRNENENKLSKLREFVSSQLSDKRVIIFCSDNTDANQIQDDFIEYEGFAKEDIEKKKVGRKITILTKDEETGLDLVDHDVIIFYDFPTSINRLDQRISRADRYGRRDTVSVYVMRPQNEVNEKSNPERFVTQFKETISSLGNIRADFEIINGNSRVNQFSIFATGLSFNSYANEKLSDTFASLFFQRSNQNFADSMVEPKQDWLESAVYELAANAFEDSSLEKWELLARKIEAAQDNLDPGKFQAIITNWNQHTFEDYKVNIDWERFTNDQPNYLRELKTELKRLATICDYGKGYQ